MKSKRKNKISQNQTSKRMVVSQPCKEIKRGSLDKLEAGLDKLFGKEVQTKADVRKAKNCNLENSQAKALDKDPIRLNMSSNNNLSFYGGRLI